MKPEMMKQCCTEDGKPDFEKMKEFMQSCGKQEFSESELAMMKQYCGGAEMLDPEKMMQLMKKCGCHMD